MRRILIGLTAAVLGIAALAGTASAADHRGHGREVRGHAYYRGQGHRFSGGRYYTRYEHPRWERRVWDEHFHRWHYWDPCLSVWYYWYPQGNCFYPVSYCP